MGIFGLFKHKVEHKESYTETAFCTPDPISNDEYQQMREKEVDWLEAHYDLTSAAGIMKIPERSDLPRPTFGDGGGFRSYTGDVDYYLRRKSGEYEEAGNIDLAILCLRKSNAIRMVSRRGYNKEDYYDLVRILARHGFLDEAKEEKEKIDSFFGSGDVDLVLPSGEEMAQQIVQDARDLGTDLVIMEPHGCACPECAKYQGRVFSLSGSDKRFPRVPSAFFKYGSLHDGCSHQFYPYMYGFATNKTDLEYALSIQKIKNWGYRRNIVSFSNRPFVDDRPVEDIEEAKLYEEKANQEWKHKQELYDGMIEFEYQRGIYKSEYKWIQENLPDICPKSYSGYMRMKNGDTKNYQKIVSAAAEKWKRLS